jgi:plastocyanin
MRRATILGIVAVVIIIIVVATAAVLLSQPKSSSPSGSSGQNTGSSGQNASVSINNFAFNPTPITITADTTVTWKNDQDVTHTVTSDQGSMESFNSGDLAPGATYSHTFNTAGTYDYHCSIHTSMHGQVIVMTSGTSNPTPGSNQSNPSPSPGY